VKLSHRRQFLRLAAGASALPALPRVARAQTYPTQSVRLIVGFPAGNASDILARLIAQWLSERLGQQFVVENRPGAGGKCRHRSRRKSVAGRLHAAACVVGKCLRRDTLRQPRSAALPDIPTMAEFVPGYEASGWYGIGAPKNTPTDIIDRLNKEINAALVDPKMKARLADLGAVPMSMTPAEFGKFIAGETDKWAKVIRAANIKAE
jgi:tripartite-type tricarboxylate transporter receptor subunit TctC